MFWKKNEREGGCNSVKAKQEFIHKQEELAVWIEAGGKLVMKRVWELSPAWNKFCCGGNQHFLMEIGAGTSPQLSQHLWGHSQGTEVSSECDLFFGFFFISTPKNVDQEENTCRNNWRSGKQDLRRKVSRAQGHLAWKQIRQRESMIKSQVSCVMGSAQDQQRGGKAARWNPSTILPKIWLVLRFLMQLQTRQGSASCPRADRSTAPIAGSVYLWLWCKS